MLDNLQLIPGEAFTAMGSVAEKVIDKVSNAVGWMVIPKANKQYQLEAEEYLIEQIKNDKNMSELAKAATISKVRKLIRDYQNQHNILSIALNSLENSAKPEKIDDDWLKYFFDGAKNISRESMAIIWGKVLAKEFNVPGSVSKSLIHILSIIEYREAVAFQKLANFTVMIEDRPYPIIFDNKFDEIYSKYGLRQEDIFILEDIGLLQKSVLGYGSHPEQDTKLKYFDFEIDIAGLENIAVGNIILSRAGEELMSIITDKTKIEKFEKFLPDIIGKDTGEILMDGSLRD